MSSLKRLQNGRYYILKKLSESEKSIVYKAKDTVLNRVVAIKMLRKAFLGEEARSRFLRETQTIAKLNHPNIVSIYEINAVRVTAKELGVKDWIKGEKKKKKNSFSSSSLLME